MPKPKASEKAAPTKFRLTDVKVQSLVAKPPKEGRLDVYDQGLPAFGLRISSTGVASWFIWYARCSADTHRGRWRRLARWPRTGSVWGDLPIRDLSRAMIATRLDEIEKLRGPVSRNRRLALIRHLLSFALDRELIVVNPAARLKLLDEASRERVLSDGELAEIWRAAEQLEEPRRQAVQFLMLTGQRRNEVFRAEVSEIDRAQRTWTIGSQRMKAARAHLVPLVPAHLDMIDSLSPHRGKGKQVYVFASPHRRESTPFGDHGGLKQDLDRHVMEARRAENPHAEAMPQWQLHDIRRTMRTTMSRLRIDSEVAERCIAHLPVGIRSIYDLWSFEQEKRAAFEAWTSFVLSLVTTRDANVIPLQR
jgi:integrase